MEGRVGVESVCKVRSGGSHAFEGVKRWRQYGNSLKKWTEREVWECEFRDTVGL